MGMNPREMAALLVKEIEESEAKDVDRSVGTVVTVGDGIATVYGLPEAMLGELLSFPSGGKGLVMNLNEDSLGVVLLKGAETISEGDPVYSTGQVLEVKVGDALLGRVVSPLAEPLDELGPIDSRKKRPIERIAPGVMERESVSVPLETGLVAIDSMVPIGRGQRELIIGDRQTGKTSIAIDAIVNQKGKGVYCVYVAIGQKNSSVAAIHEHLRSLGCLDYVTIVNASASQPSPELYIAPFAGMAMAEEWMEEGKDVLIVFDDLSKHAVAYRALSLLLRRSPGREAYPGDIFYLHSRLLERACKLSKQRGGGSITALPIVETQAGDISSYIPTNAISITDGQIFLSADRFQAGFRPAIDSGLSVSRVGSAAQTKAMKEASRSLKINLASYRENLSFAQFGSDLDSETKKILAHGSALEAGLRQVNYAPLPMEEQVIALFALQGGYLDGRKDDEVSSLLSSLREYAKDRASDLLSNIREKKALSDESRQKIKDLLELFFVKEKK